MAIPPSIGDYEYTFMAIWAYMTGGSQRASFRVDAPTVGEGMVATLEVAYVNQAAKAYVVEHGPSGDVLLAARDIYSGGSYPMMFVPSTANITIDIVGPTDMGLYRLCFDKLVSEQQTVIVDVCDKVKDSYPYGYNGQEKVNEWAGPGNFNDFAFRGQDTRTGRFISVDPLAKEFPWNSPYAFAENDVIRSLELEGLEKIYYQDVQAKKYSGLNNAIAVLRSSGIADELTKQFELGNNLTDIHIIVDKIDAPGQLGGTWVFNIRDDSPGALEQKKERELNTIRDIYINNASLNPLINTTFKENKSPIIVRIEETHVIDATKGDENLSKLAFTIAHEIRAHGLNNKTGKPIKDETTTHQEYYNDKTLKGSFSVPYDKIKKNSPAGIDKERIEKAVKKLGG